MSGFKNRIPFHLMRDSLISSLLVYYLVLATLLPALHLGFSKHCHSYDHTTHRYVDNLVISSEEINEGEIGQFYTDPSLTKNKAHRLKILPCAICNGLIQSSIQIDLGSYFIEDLCNKSQEEICFDSEYRSQDVIIIAPKQSPPTQA